MRNEFRYKEPDWKDEQFLDKCAQMKGKPIPDPDYPGDYDPVIDLSVNQ